MTYLDVQPHIHWKLKGLSDVDIARESNLGGFFLGLNTSLLINSHIAIMTINKSKDQKTSFKEAYMNLLLRILSLAWGSRGGLPPRRRMLSCPSRFRYMMIIMY